MTAGYYNILYLSNRNTTRSIFAEAVANGKGRGRFKGYSAGLNPASAVDPVALDILRLSDYPTEGLRPKHWSEFAGADAPPFDFVLSLRSRFWRAATALAGAPRHSGLALP